MTGAPDARVAVAVITHQRRDELLRTLGSLRALPEQPGVVVVDNGSTDGTADAVASQHPEVEVLRPGRNLKRFWQDAHNVIGVLSLPMHVMFAVTGAMFMARRGQGLRIEYVVATFAWSVSDCAVFCCWRALT